ncbi:MAG: type II toxin-antitoxin system Phd/YefM family antitoxin [Dehalococcoidia bacterium]|nr:type II toxin-antitoxin system Phd/YefM family antitoxin [Dehalococcoidia bacterium]
MHDILRSRFVGMNELRQQLPKLLESLAQEGEDVVITRQGKPAAVLMDVEKYLEVQLALREFSDAHYLAELLKARQEIRDGDGIAAGEVFRKKGL